MPKLITDVVPSWEIRFRAKNVRHVSDGTVMARRMAAVDKVSALLMLKISSSYSDCDIIECVEVYELTPGADNPRTDVSRPKLIDGGQ